MAYNIVKLNKAKCKVCGDVLVSTDSTLNISCACGELTVGGGSSWVYRKGDKLKYDELSILNFQDVPNNIIETAKDINE